MKIKKRRSGTESEAVSYLERFNTYEIAELSAILPRAMPQPVRLFLSAYQQLHSLFS